MPSEVKPVSELSDDELLDELREQVNIARQTNGQHDRVRTPQIAEEAYRRGWSTRKPSLNNTIDCHEARSTPGNEAELPEFIVERYVTTEDGEMRVERPGSPAQPR